jgi:serine/threonine protein kinase
MPALDDPRLLRSLDATCDAFDVAWREGKRPRIEEQLAAVAEALRPSLLHELIRIELEWRCRFDEQPSAKEYAARFPDHASDIEGWLAEAREAARQVATASTTGCSTDDPGQPATVTHCQATPTMLPPPAGRLGEYELLECLGRGGMGEVWKARHRKLDKLVAIKLLLAGGAGDRFLREMQAVGKLDHPNLVKAYDAGEQDGALYLVMELVEGTDLGRRVRQQGPLSVAEATTAARQVAAGLAYLHASGFVHRDLKPSNLMRTPDGTIKVLDLGLARRIDATPIGLELTQTGMGMGTPDYLAPEQVSDAASADPRADLYGLGATLFHLLTGRPPFADRDSKQAKLLAHQTQEAPDVRSLRPEIPAALASLVSRLLAKEPPNRPPSAAAVLAELTPSRSHRPVAWLVAGLAIAALGAIAVLVWRDYNPSPVPDTNVVSNSKPATDRQLVDSRLRVQKLDVHHFATEAKGDRPHGILGRDSYDTCLDDSVTVEGKLSRPAYAYLIAFRPDGTEEVCYPEGVDAEPELTDRPRYPSVSRGVNYGLNEGEGMQVFAVVASSRPLPPYREWRAGRSASPWRPFATLPGVVWQDDGTVVEGLSRGGLLADGGTRGKGKEVPGKSQVVRLTDWLRQAPGVEEVMVVGFRVGPKTMP